MNSEAIEGVHRALTERRYFSLRFNFPFAEAGKRRPDSMPVLRRTMRAALGALGRDPTAAPAHLFLGGIGLGGQVAADLASARVRVDGRFLMAYPLHPAGKPEEREPEQLFRIVSPAMFIQGDRDPTCDIEVLRQTLVRVGAPTVLRVIPEADRQFKVLKKSGRTQQEVVDQVTNALDDWIQSILGGTTSAREATSTSNRSPSARWRTSPISWVAARRARRWSWIRPGTSMRCSTTPRPTA